MGLVSSWASMTRQLNFGMPYQLVLQWASHCEGTLVASDQLHFLMMVLALSQACGT
jgi:hypothetical protein